LDGIDHFHCQGKMKNMRFFFILLAFFFTTYLAFPQSEWETFYEKSKFLETPTYGETIDYIKRLSKHSGLISYQSFGISPQGRDLPLLIVDQQDVSDVALIRENAKGLVLIQACIHAGESDGKDAGLMLLRDIAIKGQYQELLQSLTILFVPILNVDGHEDFSKYNRINQNGPEKMGWRATAQRLNLNRDYLKADAPEMQALIRLYQEVLPDFYIDCHVTDGADYQYPLTYGLQIHGNLNQDQSEWLGKTYLPYVEQEMERSGNPIAPYMDFVEWHNPASGIRSYMETPRYSGGYAAINNRPALLIETHMLKDYQTRVNATYDMLLVSLQLIAKQKDELKTLNEQADQKVANAQAGDHYTISFRTSDSFKKFTYRGFAYNVEKSELSGGNWYKYSDEPKIIEINKYAQEPEKIVRLPRAYVIPVQWTEVIAKLDLHGVKYHKLKNDSIFDVGTYIFKNVKWNERPFEGRIRINYEVEPLKKSMKFPKGSAVVNLNQRANHLAVHLLEPEAPDALVRWGFFNTIFEQKEYAESYVMEAIAREMLKNDPELKNAFEQKLTDDKEFAGSPWAILNWFYEKTPFWDKSLGIYPVGRIEY